MIRIPVIKKIRGRRLLRGKSKNEKFAEISFGENYEVWKWDYLIKVANNRIFLKLCYVHLANNT